MRNLLALSVLISTIVGVGMFGLPYIGSRSGFVIAAAMLLFLTVVITTVHLLYGEIICRTKEKHRLVGYADKYLGRQGKRMVSVSVILGFTVPYWFTLLLEEISLALYFPAQLTCRYLFSIFFFSP